MPIVKLSGGVCANHQSKRNLSRGVPGGDNPPRRGWRGNPSRRGVRGGRPPAGNLTQGKFHAPAEKKWSLGQWLCQCTPLPSRRVAHCANFGRGGARSPSRRTGGSAHPKFAQWATRRRLGRKPKKKEKDRSPRSRRAGRKASAAGATNGSAGHSQPGRP